jgi:hypothetical protein
MAGDSESGRRGEGGSYSISAGGGEDDGVMRNGAIGEGRAARVTVYAVTTGVGMAVAEGVWLEFIRLCPASARSFPPPEPVRPEGNGRPTNLAGHWASSTKYHERIMWDKV